MRASVTVADNMDPRVGCTQYPLAPFVVCLCFSFELLPFGTGTGTRAWSCNRPLVRVGEAAPAARVTPLRALSRVVPLRRRRAAAARRTNTNSVVSCGDNSPLAHLSQSVMRHAKLISMMAFWMPYAFILAMPSGTSDSGTRCSSHWSLQAHVCTACGWVPIAVLELPFSGEHGLGRRRLMALPALGEGVAVTADDPSLLHVLYGRRGAAHCWLTGPLTGPHSAAIFSYGTRVQQSRLWFALLLPLTLPPHPALHPLVRRCVHMCASPSRNALSCPPRLANSCVAHAVRQASRSWTPQKRKGTRMTSPPVSTLRRSTYNVAQSVHIITPRATMAPLHARRMRYAPCTRRYLLSIGEKALLPAARSSCVSCVRRPSEAYPP